MSDFDTIDLSKCKDSRDFGRGFYLSSDIEHAESFAQSRKRKLERLYRLRHIDRKIVEYRYNFTFDDENAEKSLKVRKFDSANSEWLRFVVENRTSDVLKSDYDIVIGPTADAAAYSIIMDSAEDLIRSDYDKSICEEIIHELHPERLSGQYCFCSQESLSYLAFATPEKVVIDEQI